MAIALQPMSCSLSATSTILIESWSQPSHVLTVTGKFVLSTIALGKLSIKHMTFSIPAPPP